MGTFCTVRAAVRLNDTAFAELVENIQPGFLEIGDPDAGSDIIQISYTGCDWLLTSNALLQNLADLGFRLAVAAHTGTVTGTVMTDCADGDHTRQLWSFGTDGIWMGETTCFRVPVAATLHHHVDDQLVPDTQTAVFQALDDPACECGGWDYETDTASCLADTSAPRHDQLRSSFTADHLAATHGPVEGTVEALLSLAAAVAYGPVTYGIGYLLDDLDRNTLHGESSYRDRWLELFADTVADHVQYRWSIHAFAPLSTFDGRRLCDVPRPVMVTAGRDVLVPCDHDNDWAIPVRPGTSRACLELAVELLMEGAVSSAGDAYSAAWAAVHGD